jgi:hypothetical protein
MGEEHRQYIRHPSDIPLLYELAAQPDAPQKEIMRNISLGGVSFRNPTPLASGTALTIRIPLTQPEFRAPAVVVWCRLHARHYDVGVQFLDEHTGFRARIIEQICYIEQYKQDVLAREGRTLSGEEAAQEWIAQYASEFPRPRT